MFKPRILIPNGYYHIYNRGNQKQIIFKSEKDFYTYLTKLKKYTQKYNIQLLAYCLMPNHVHILCRAAEPKNISKMMHGLQRAFTGYFNKHYGKVGHLWQGRFKTRLITDEKYLVDCALYIEYNPVRAGMIEMPGDYKFSSFKERNGFEEKLKLLTDQTLFPA